jgi:Matrixin
VNLVKRERRPQIRKGAVLIAASGALLLGCLLAMAYTPYQDNVGGVAVPIGWNNDSVTWRLNPSLGSNIDTTGGPDVPTAVAAAFNVWPQTLLNGVRINDLTVTRGPDTLTTDPNVNDCVNVISLVPSNAVTFDTGVVAYTQIASLTPDTGQSGPPFTYNYCGGITTDRYSVIIDADMVFNRAWTFSTATPTPLQDLDLFSVASHEFGHLLGMEHNGIAHTMMYPFGDLGIGQTRELAVDDVGGIAFLYPADNFLSATAAISGVVTLDGTGVFAAHVVAVDSVSGLAVMDTLSDADGNYILDGIPEGTYRILAIPLIGPLSVDNYSGWACGYATDPANCTGFPDNPIDYTGTFF